MRFLTIRQIRSKTQLETRIKHAAPAALRQVVTLPWTATTFDGPGRAVGVRGEAAQSLRERSRQERSDAIVPSLRNANAAPGRLG